MQVVVNIPEQYLLDTPVLEIPGRLKLYAAY